MQINIYNLNEYCMCNNRVYVRITPNKCYLMPTSRGCKMSNFTYIRDSVKLSIVFKV